MTKEQQRAIAIAKARKRLLDKQKAQAVSTSPAAGIDYVAADAETDAPTPASMARQRMVDLGLAVAPEQTDVGRKVLAGVGREIAEGATLGASGELVGAGTGAMAMLKGEDFMPAFKSGMGEFEAKRKAFKKEYPITGFASEVAGSLPLGLAAGARLAGTKLAPRLLAGLGGGTTYGFLGTEGDIEDRTKGGLIGGGLGLGLPLTGQLAQSALGQIKEPAKRLIEKGVDLTPGQARGRLTGLTESLLGKTFFGDVVGVGSSQKKAFEQFNIKAIEDVMKPLGYKVDLDEPIADAVNSAKIFADKKFKEAIGKSSLPVTGRVIQDVMGLKTPENIKRFRSKYNLREQDFAPFKAEVDDAVMSRIEDSSITGEMMQDAVSQLGETATNKMSGTAAERRIGKALFAYREELLDYIQSKAKNAKKFKEVRDINRDIRPLIDASKAAGAGLFSPAQYRKKLESQFGAKWKDTPQGKALQDYLEVLGTGPAPKEVPIAQQSAMTIAPKAALTTGTGLVGAAAPYLSAAAAATLPLVYSTGQKGLSAGRMVTGAPGLLAEKIPALPVIPGMAGGLLAGD